MKYILLAIPVIVLAAISMIIGAILYVWRFDRKDWKHGVTYINENVICFTDWIKQTSSPKTF